SHCSGAFVQRLCNQKCDGFCGPFVELRQSFRSQKLSFIRLLPIMFGKGSIGLTHSQTKSGLVLSASPLRFSSVGSRLSKLVLFRDRFRSLSNVNRSGSQNASKNAAAAAEKTE